MFSFKPLLAFIAFNVFFISNAQVFNECTAQDDYSGVPGDCAKFRRCVNGRFVEFTCAPGTLFDASNKICEHEVLVNCLSRYMLEDECGMGDDFSPVYEDCSKFLRCDHGYFVELQCPKGTLFDKVQKFCEHADLVDCINILPATTEFTTQYTTNSSVEATEPFTTPTQTTVPTTAEPAISATTTLSTTTLATTTFRTTSSWDLITNRTPTPWMPPSFGCTAFDDFSGVWNDCHKYRRCFDGYFFLISCPDDWKFDYILKQCLDPSVDDIVCYMPPPSVQRP